ncbi:twin-arginine translocase subunit TatC [Desulfurivibrio alkaliphilus]|nr:twin-arginine translocase subunit TatC [Desulfurivibrio alkaliphilus]MDF1615162.1 twin-arginine translocase subunit TatC [Desulfurivibrio alkaliphilus]
MAFTAALLLALPVIFWQFWSFVAPGLYRHEKKVVLPFTVISVLCFLAGAAFAYYVIFPPAFRFLVGYSHEYLATMPGVSEYFGLSLRLFIAFGVIFQLPVFMVMLARLRVVDAPFLVRHRRYAILLAFIIAAMLTPTADPVNQLLMVGPLIVLYEISIIMVKWFGDSAASAES